MLQVKEKPLGRTKLKKVSSYIEPALYEKLERISELDSRSVSQMVAVLIKKAIAEAEAEGKL